MEKIVFHHTPRYGSWLNMAEIEIGIMENQCLKRRIPDIKFLKKELAAWENNRNRKEAKINWTFTKEKAKEKFRL